MRIRVARSILGMLKTIYGSDYIVMGPNNFHNTHPNANKMMFYTTQKAPTN